MLRRFWTSRSFPNCADKSIVILAEEDGGVLEEVGDAIHYEQSDGVLQVKGGRGPRTRSWHLHITRSIQPTSIHLPSNLLLPNWEVQIQATI